MTGMIFLHHTFAKQTKPRAALVSRRVVYLLLLLNMALVLTFIPREAKAVNRQVIFHLANLQQWVDMTYTYNGSKMDNNRTSQDHGFEENYHLGIDYAILTPRLANGTLKLDFGLYQNHESGNDSFDDSGSSSGLNLEYMADMLLFDRSFHPISLMANQSREQINAPFSENHDLNSSAYSAGISLRNDFLPTQFYYRHYETETNGLTRDRRQTSDDLNLNASFETGEFSTTDLRAHSVSINNDIEKSDTKADIDSYDLEGRNRLEWAALSHDQSLYSSYRYQHDRGDSEIRTTYWDERLDLQLGEALDTGAEYSYSKNESEYQDRQEKRGRAWIEHRLFRSLTSRYEYGASHIDYDSGTESIWRQQLNLDYTKNLPQQSYLNLSCTYGYGETDRDLDSSQLFSIDERLIVRVDNNYLANPDVIESSVEVFSGDRSLLYTEGIDYQLEVEGRRTKLVFYLPFPSGGISLGDTLSIDYAYQVNSTIEYSTTLTAASASIDLFEQLYRLYTSLSKTDQDHISGETDVSTLDRTTFALIGFEVNPDQVSFGGSYEYQDSYVSTDKTLEAFADYRREKERTRFHLRLTGRRIENKNKNDFSAADENTTNSNSLLLNADYRIRLARNRTLNLRGHIIDVRGDNRRQDDIYLGAFLESRWYKFTLRVSADVNWQIYKDDTSRQDRVSIDLRRYF